MIEKGSYRSFASKLNRKTKGAYPLSAQIELTYRCNLDCVHCYCKDSVISKELSASEWKGILDQLHAAGTIFLTITGGEPFVRKDFFDIYGYARKKGFLVTLFTNGTLLSETDIKRLKKYPPYAVEVSLTGVRKETFESITRVRGSFKKVMANIQELAGAGLPLVLKSVGLEQNKAEIKAIKEFTERLLGKKKFKFDSFITPGLDGNRTPCHYRLSVEDILAIEESDPDMRAQREREFKAHKSLSRDPVYKYHCSSWLKQFYITPSGVLRFCHMTDKYSTDLKKFPFDDGFYNRFPLILEERFRTASKCVKCKLREYCYYCPARAYLEAGDEESPVPYFCKLAKATKERIEKARSL